MESSDEYLDIVNEKDEIIGRGKRNNIHLNHQIHRGIHIFIINSKKNILLQKRSTKKTYYPGFWDASVGAQVLSQETYKKAALRELHEELGISAKPNELKIIGNYKSYSPRQRENRRLFIYRSDGPFTVDQNEVEKIEFWPIKKIKKAVKSGRKFTQGFKISFRKFTNITNLTI